MNLTEHVFYLFYFAATFQVLLARNHRLKKYRSVGLTAYDEELPENNKKRVIHEEGLKRDDEVAYILIKAQKKDGDDIYHGAVYDLLESYYLSIHNLIQHGNLNEESDEKRAVIKNEIEYNKNRIYRLLERFSEAGIQVKMTIVYPRGVRIKKRTSRNRRRQKNKRSNLERHEGDELKRVDAAASIIADAYHSDDEKINPDAVYDLFLHYYKGFENNWKQKMVALQNELVLEDERETVKESIEKDKEKAERFMEKLQEEGVDFQIV